MVADYPEFFQYIANKNMPFYLVFLHAGNPNRFRYLNAVDSFDCNRDFLLKRKYYDNLRGETIASQRKTPFYLKYWFNNFYSLYFESLNNCMGLLNHENNYIKPIAIEKKNFYSANEYDRKYVVELGGKSQFGSIKIEARKSGEWLNLAMDDDNRVIYLKTAYKWDIELLENYDYNTTDIKLFIKNREIFFNLPTILNDFDFNKFGNNEINELIKTEGTDWLTVNLKNNLRLRCSSISTGTSSNSQYTDLLNICTDINICPSTGISRSECANFYSKKCSDEINTNQKTNFFEGYCKQHKSINPSNWANLAWDNICSKGDNIIELPQCKQLFLDTNNAPYSKRDFFDPKLNDICNKKYIPEIREYRILDKDGDEIIEKIQIVIPQYIKEENKSLQYSNKSLVEIENINNKIFLQLYSGGSQQAYEYHIKDMCGCYWEKANLVIVKPNGTIETRKIDLNKYLIEKQYSNIKDPLIQRSLEQLALCISKVCLNTTSRQINPFFKDSCSNICIQSATNTAIDSITGKPIVNQSCNITVNEKKDINEPNINIKTGMKRNNINRTNVKTGNNINRKDILNIPTRINGKYIN